MDRVVVVVKLLSLCVLCQRVLQGQAFQGLRVHLGWCFAKLHERRVAFVGQLQWLFRCNLSAQSMQFALFAHWRRVHLGSRTAPSTFPGTTAQRKYAGRCIVVRLVVGTPCCQLGVPVLNDRPQHITEEEVLRSNWGGVEIWRCGCHVSTD